MKYILFPLLTVLGCFGFTACEQEEVFRLDTTLAGSVRMDAYFMDAEFIYNDRVLTDSANRLATLSINKWSDDHIMLSCGTGYGAKEKMALRIKHIPLSGEAFDVTFDYSTDDAEGQINGDRIYSSIRASVKGWIKRPDMIKNGFSLLTSPATPNFLCDITIEGEADGKHVKIKIKAVDPHVPFRSLHRYSAAER